VAQGVKALYLLVDAWFTSPKFCKAVRELGLHVIGRLKADGTLYAHGDRRANLRQLYRTHRHVLTPAPEMGLALTRVPVTCGNGLAGGIIFARGYQEPPPDAKPGGQITPKSSWAAFFSTDLMGAMILKRSSISRISRKPTSEVLVAPMKSIMIARLKSGRTTSFRLSPLMSILGPLKLPIIPHYII
jgi:hypothetical protein